MTPDPADIFRSGWDRLDEIVQPLSDAGVPYILILGIPGTDETRSIAASGLTVSDVEFLRKAFENHFEKIPPDPE